METNEKEESETEEDLAFLHDEVEEQGRSFLSSFRSRT